MTHSVGVLLLAAVAGYWVLERAATHKDGLKIIGQLLGSAIIVVSLVGVACKVWYAATCPPGSTGKAWHCPFKAKTAPPAQSP